VHVKSVAGNFRAAYNAQNLCTAIADGRAVLQFWSNSTGDLNYTVIPIAEVESVGLEEI